MASLKELFLFVVTSIFLVNGSLKEDHQVRGLPGLEHEINFKHYSGYLEISDTKKLAYWFFESQNDPNSDPLLLWLNGGPGCSSFYGTVHENGPFLLPVGDGLDLVFRENPHAYNMFANVLYVEAPAAVGFSKDSGLDQYDDNITAADNLQFLKNFLIEYPELQGRDFYISGISYAGCYVPYLADKVLDAGDELKLNLKGIILGNAVTQFNLWDRFQIPTLVAHGLRSAAELAKWEQKYCPKGYDRFCGKELAHSPIDYILRPLNAYDIAQPCYSGGTCEGDSMVRYFNQKEVQDALHFEKTEWIYCNTTIDFGPVCEDAEPFVRRILDKNVKALYLYGTNDFICPVLEGDFFTRRIGRSGRVSNWYVDKTYAGTKTVYENNLTFTTILNAGHTAGIAKPKQVANAIRKFINDEEDWDV